MSYLNSSRQLFNQLSETKNKFKGNQEIILLKTENAENLSHYLRLNCQFEITTGSRGNVTDRKRKLNFTLGWIQNCNEGKLRIK